MSANRSRFACLLLATAALMTLQCICCTKDPTVDESRSLAIDYNKNGVELKVPFLPNLRESWGEGKRQYHLKAIEPVLKYFIETSDKIIGTKVTALAWISIGKNLIGKVGGFLATVMRTDPEFTTNVGKEFKKDAIKLIENALKQSGDLVAKMKEDGVEKDSAKLKSDIHAFLEAILEGVRGSPVAAYVDWLQGTVDGTPIQDHCGEILARVRYHGYETVTKLARTSVSLAARTL